LLALDVVFTALSYFLINTPSPDSGAKLKLFPHISHSLLMAVEQNAFSLDTRQGALLFFRKNKYLAKTT
jgi:hypothetical protein